MFQDYLSREEPQRKNAWGLLDGNELSSVNGLRVLVAEDDGMIAEAICNG